MNRRVPWVFVFSVFVAIALLPLLAELIGHMVACQQLSPFERYFTRGC